MGIIVETLEQAGLVEMITLDRKLWLTADKSRVVEDGDPDSAFLYGIAGHKVPKKEAVALGVYKEPIVQEVRSAKEKAKGRRPANNKMVPKPGDK